MYANDLSFGLNSDTIEEDGLVQLCYSVYISCIIGDICCVFDDIFRRKVSNKVPVTSKGQSRSSTMRWSDK